MQTTPDRLPGSSVFTFPISPSTRRWAQSLAQAHPHPDRFRQGYLNGLAVRVTAYYLECLGYATDLSASHLNDPMLRAVLDLADLVVVGVGRLECCPVMPEAVTLSVPPGGADDRLGYVAVQFNPALTQARLLGFAVTMPARGEISLAELRSLDTFPAYLDSLGAADPVPRRERLSHWWHDQFGASWQTLETLLGHAQPALAWGLRGPTDLQTTSIQRAKLIDLGVQLGVQTVILLVAIAPHPDQPDEFRLLVQLHPAQGESTLPADLVLSLLAAGQEPLQSVRSRQQDNYIQLKRFQAQRGETFEVVIAYGAAQVVEAFAV